MKRFTRLIGRHLAFFLLLSNLPVQLNAQNIAKRITVSNGDTLPFLEYKPAAHDAVGNTRKYPLIVFLHGGGERSNNSSLAPGSPVWKLEGTNPSTDDFSGFGPSRLVRLGYNMAFTWNQQTDTFMVLSPMSRLTFRTGPNAGNTINVWPLEYIQGIISYAKDSLKVDTNRIYLTGLSYGGGGTFNYLNSSLANVKKLAAAAPICAWLTGLSSNGQGYVANANLPLWGFHAEDDPTSNGSYTLTQNSINGVNALNPQQKALFTLWPDGGHYIWPRVYNIDKWPNGYDGIINIYEWFLGQNKSLPVNVLPVANVGNDITVSTSTGTATLNGGTSTDADGTIVRYVWKKIGAAIGTIATPLGSGSSTTISNLTTAGLYKYELIVVDNRAAIARDTLAINVVNDDANAVTISPSGRITTGDVTQLNNASKFTLEAQFKYDATVSGWTTIMRKSISLTDRIMLHIGPNNNSIYVMVGNGSNSYGYTAANAVSPGAWYHVAAVFDGTQTGDANRLKLYLNGVQQTLSFSATPIPSNTSSTNTAPFMAGGEPSCCYLNGTIDEVRVWNTALSGATISTWKDKLLGTCHPNIANLVLYWPLNNDATPTTATAELGTTYTGTISNGSYVGSNQATDTTGCSPGKAVAISSSGRITTTDVTQLNNATKFTLEAQFKYTATVSGWTTIMRKSTSLTDRIMLHIGPNNNSIYVMVGNGSNSYGYTAANAVSPGAWYHVAAVFDGTQTGDANRLKLYLNGVQQTLSFSATPIPSNTSSTNTAPFMAGGEPACCYVNGTIDEVRVWNTALSGAIISAWKDKLLGSCHPNIANLVVYWPLNNNANPAVATAELGTSYTGTITNGSYVGSNQATDTTGCGKAATISSSGRITTTDVTQLNNASKFTLEALFKYDATVSTYTTLMRKSTSLSDRIMVHIGPNNNSIHLVVGNGSNSYGVTAANAVSPGSWYHFAAVFDGTQTGDANRLKLYINGVQQTLSFSATPIPSSTSSTNTAPFMAGGEPSCCYLNGTIDEVRVWNTALSGATISAWKDKLLGSCHPDIANLVVYWPLNNDANPAVATAALGTSYTGTITNGSYVSSNQATESSGCGGARVTLATPAKELKEKPFTGKIYPNPTEGPVQIELNAAVTKSVSVSVLDMSGKYLYINRRPLIKGKNRISLNISSLPSGIYIIEVGDGKAIVEKYKVLKQ